MCIFGAPNLVKLKKNRDVNKLIKALSYKKDIVNVRQAAFDGVIILFH